LRRQLEEDSQWTLLKTLKLDSDKKESIKERIKESISTRNYNQPVKHRWLELKGILATCLLFLIAGGFIWKLTQGTDLQTGEGTETREFSWSLTEVYGQKSEEGFTLYRKNEEIPVGIMKKVNQDERNKIIASGAMHVQQELENFPYSTTMYIEHVKMPDTSLRYHFFIENQEGESIYFSFDYPKLEYAEIFEAIGTLKLKGMKPYEHPEMLYVNHGYGRMFFPVGIQPINIGEDKEIYLWEEVTDEIFAIYLSKLEELLPSWTRDGTTFTSHEGSETVKISLEGKKLIYEFWYQEQEE